MRSTVWISVWGVREMRRRLSGERLLVRWRLIGVNEGLGETGRRILSALLERRRALSMLGVLRMRGTLGVLRAAGRLRRRRLLVVLNRLRRALRRSLACDRSASLLHLLLELLLLEHVHLAVGRARILVDARRRTRLMGKRAWEGNWWGRVRTSELNDERVPLRAHRLERRSLSHAATQYAGSEGHERRQSYQRSRFAVQSFENER